MSRGLLAHRDLVLRLMLNGESLHNVGKILDITLKTAMEDLREEILVIARARRRKQRRLSMLAGRRKRASQLNPGDRNLQGS